MNLRSKTYLVIGLIVLISATILYFASTYVLQKARLEMEQNTTRQCTDRVLNAIQQESDALSSNARDYSGWDDTYAFVQNPRQEYIDSNYTLPTYINLQIDVALITDESSRLIMARAYDRQNMAEQPVTESVIELAEPGSPLTSISAIDQSKDGIVVLPEGLMLVSAWPVVTSDYTGPARGTLIMGRWLNTFEMAHLNDISHLSFSLYPAREDFEFLASAGQTVQTESGLPLAVVPFDQQNTAGYMMMSDVFGNDTIELQVLAPRRAYQQAFAFLDVFTLVLVVIILLNGLFIVWFISRSILSRLMAINRVVQEIPFSHDLHLRVPVRGRDELSALAGGINDMLHDIEGAQADLQNQVLYLNTLLDNLSEMFISYDEDLRITYVNQRSVDFWGYEPDDLLGCRIHELIEPAFKDKIVRIFEQEIQNGPIADFEVPVQHKDGSKVLARINATRILLDGQPAGGVILAEDITVRKQTEENMKYVSNHDSLTGVFNRTYYENYLKSLNLNIAAPIGIIVCDLDGLKFINDTLGHSAGDQVLVEAAEVIQKCIPKNGILARIGGDEFALVVQCDSTDDIETTCSHIRETIAEYNRLNPQIPMAISIGAALRTHSAENLNDVYRRADNFMYREKLHSKRSNRASIVAALTSAMEARDFATSGHEDRLQDIITSLGSTLGLPRERLRDMRLLAKFHDIGKVGIPDRVLFKPGRLTPEETAIMQQHSEIGHRIALAVPELVPIADWILKHHEWWNGAGYPVGLNGEDIPLECRILAIADAYDAMVSDRPYRKAMGHENALAELEACAGTQLDPFLVRRFISLYDSEDEAAQSPV